MFPSIDSCTRAAHKSWSMLSPNYYYCRLYNGGIERLTLHCLSPTYALLNFLAVYKLDGKGCEGVEYTSELAMFYRSCIHSLLGGTKKNDLLLYLIAARHTLSVYITKHVC